MAEYLTARLPGTGGSMKECPEDFRVEEIPLYPPCDEGKHLFLEVEKTGLTTHELLRRLSRALGVKEREIGYAGLKDARATTRQTVSLPQVSPERALELELDGIRILSARRHRHKLRLGHLAGNRFVIRLRRVREDALEASREILRELATAGVPNRFGEQRYGALDNSHRIGRALMRRQFEEAARLFLGEPERIDNNRWRRGAACFAAGDLQSALKLLPARLHHERNLIRALQGGRSFRQAMLNLPRPLLRLFLSAYQSSLFDRLLGLRLDSLGILWAGDLAFKHANGACFVVQDLAAEQPRAERFEISPTAPLFGFKVPLAQGPAGIREENLLAEEGLKTADFRLGEGLAMAGERRPLRVPLSGADVRREGGDLILSFSLPRGSYATAVLREVMKTAP